MRLVDCMLSNMLLSDIGLIENLVFDIHEKKECSSSSDKRENFYLGGHARHEGDMAICN